MRIICSWCDKDLGEREPLDYDAVSHGICQACMDAMFAEAEADVLRIGEQSILIPQRSEEEHAASVAAEYARMGEGEPRAYQVIGNEPNEYRKTRAFITIMDGERQVYNVQRTGISRPGAYIPARAVYKYSDELYILEDNWLIPLHEWYGRLKEKATP